MKAILLGLKDYENHMTDEGHQLQCGLEAAGVEVWGSGFANDCTDAAAIIERAKPDVAIVIDRREWDPKMRGAFDKSAAYSNIDKLAANRSVCEITICKDAASILEYQRTWAKDLQADGYICYYHPDAVTRYATWVKPHQIIRTYHSVDATRVWKIHADRGTALVSGARNPAVYPLRETCIRYREHLGLSYMRHPGYGNCGTCTPHYLDALRTWKVHVCCASQYGFALRKIMESVACGCTVITDLPSYDVLPEIDDALIRVRTNIAVHDLQRVIREAVQNWNLADAVKWSDKAKAFYDWRVTGQRLYDNIERFWIEWKQRRAA